MNKYICNYCFQEIDLKKEAAVACDLCDSPYHKECWDENYKCATYGCRIRRCHSINNINETSIRRKFICNYCLNEIEDGEEVIFCDRCESPYHIDCWEENHRCATYGCNCSSYHRDNRTPENTSSIEINTEPREPAEPAPLTINYVCEYCLNEIENINNLVFCDNCNSAYHINCWREHNRCINPNCNSRSYHRAINPIENNNTPNTTTGSQRTPNNTPNRPNRESAPTSTRNEETPINTQTSTRHEHENIPVYINAIYFYFCFK